MATKIKKKKVHLGRLKSHNTLVMNFSKCYTLLNIRTVDAMEQTIDTSDGDLCNVQHRGALECYDSKLEFTVN